MRRIIALTFVLVALSRVNARAWALVCEVPYPVTMVDRVDSATAFPGMVFRFKLTQTVRIGDELVPVNTIGYGVVREVTAASNHDRNGSLTLEPRELIFGKQILQVMADPREGSLWAPAQTLIERGTNYLPIPGIVRTAVNEVRWGKNVVIGPGFNFHVVSLGDARNLAPCHKVGQ
ncbi:MAG TPA: hypothetical protein VMD47_12215 [Candidatus Acidoferrales bacterium]|nr:hypothetical protein [Candidatus Acidoferrales bacterium]